MNCMKLEALLELRDPDARCDRPQVSRHLGGCRSCRSRWPEMVLLLDIPRRRRPSRLIGTAAAVVFVAAVAVSAVQPALSPAPDFQTEPARMQAPPGADPRTGGTAFPTVLSDESVVLVRGRRIESCLSCEVWTAPRPRCLDMRR